MNSVVKELKAWRAGIRGTRIEAAIRRDAVARLNAEQADLRRLARLRLAACPLCRAPYRRPGRRDHRCVAVAMSVPDRTSASQPARLPAVLPTAPSARFGTDIGVASHQHNIGTHDSAPPAA